MRISLITGSGFTVGVKQTSALQVVASSVNTTQYSSPAIGTAAVSSATVIPPEEGPSYQTKVPASALTVALRVVRSIGSSAQTVAVGAVTVGAGVTVTIILVVAEQPEASDVKVTQNSD